MDHQTTSAAAPDPSAAMSQNATLQGTEAPVHQGPFTTLDECCSRVPASISLTLSYELVEHILLLLDTKSVLTCKFVNRELNEIIQSSILLQYFRACKAAGVIDNPRLPLSYAEGLKALEKWEDAWRMLKPVFEIPSHGHEQGRPGFSASFGTAVHEHDLIVNFISSDIGNQGDMRQHSLNLILLKFSTGDYPPLARHPQNHLQVYRSPEPRPFLASSIVGDNLALVFHSRDGTSSDKLLIFDWKTGHKRLEHVATKHAYTNSSLVFVTPELLLVPNLILSRFEVWHPSHPHPNPPVQILSQYPLSHVPTTLTILAAVERPEDSIIIINVHLESFEHARYGSYMLIMHRHALCDPDYGSVRLDAQSKSVSTTPHQGSSPLTRGFANSPNSTSTYPPTLSKLGPPISRWLRDETRAGVTQAGRFPTAAGQRYAFLIPDPRNRRKLTLSVADFNPHNVRRNAEMMAQLRGGNNSRDGNNEEELEILYHKGVFSEDVYMGLKCVVYHAQDEYDRDLVLMDEDRLLGLKLIRGR
ncbi:hypothetical protein JOM56_005409 [Amanita muscaria]